MFLSYSAILLVVSTVTALVIPDPDFLDNNTTIPFVERDSIPELSQNGASIEMKFISQNHGTVLHMLENYVFLQPAGSGVTVYVHDSGINVEHDEFTKKFDNVEKGTIEWLSPNIEGKQQTKWTDPSSDGHGTCVANEVIGFDYGVAKGANLIMVPTIDLENDDYVKAGLQAIIDDIEAKRKKDPHFLAVVNFSYQLGFERYTDKSFRTFYKKIYELDIVMVIAAGNGGFYGQTPVDTYPALYAREFPNIIVVGSVDIDGFPSRFSHGGDLVNIFAPGTIRSDELGIKCAGKTGKTGEVNRFGTSYAAPTVAGLAAYLMSTEPALARKGSVAQKVKARIIELGYIRPTGHSLRLTSGTVRPVRAIWNDLEGKYS